MKNKNVFVPDEEWLKNEPIVLGTWEEASKKIFGDTKPIYITFKEKKQGA